MAHAHSSTRLDADAEGQAVIVRVYADMLEGSIELTALDARQLAAALINSADFVEKGICRSNVNRRGS